MWSNQIYLIMSSSQLTINDIVPRTVKRVCAKHPRAEEGSPCPNSLAKEMENGALYFTAGGQLPAAIGGEVLVHAVNTVVPGKGQALKFESIPNVLDGMPVPKMETYVAPESLHGLRTRDPKLDPNTVDIVVRKLAAEPRTRSPSNTAAKIALLSHPSLRTCQSDYHDSPDAAEDKVFNRRVAMCNPCWDNYRFKRAAKGRRYYPASNLRKSARLWMHLQPLFSATPEAYCGYIAVCSAQTAEFKASKKLPINVLEEIGLATALYTWAMPYFRSSYSALRLLHTCRPERATALQSRTQLRRPQNELMWWKRAEEQGYSARPLVQIRQNGWGTQIHLATHEHNVVWDKENTFSVAALGVIAAVTKMHSRIKCIVHARVGARPSKPLSRLPPVRMTRAGATVIKIQNAENVTWAYAWRCLCKAEDVADSIGVKGPIDVTLELEGNPLAKPLTSTPHPAWDAIRATSHAGLLPEATGHFFKWALPQAKKREEMASLTTADMYPATAEQVEKLREQVKLGFPPAEDVVLRDAAKRMFGEKNVEEEMFSIPLLGGDAV